MSFLSAMLPTIVGAGVGIATGNPYAGAAAAGALGYSRNGSLTEGLMAGLAGYGGAGLAQGITPGMVSSELGATTANEATKASMQSAMAEQATQQAAAQPTNFVGADFDQLPISQQPAYGSEQFGGAQFQPRPDINPSNYGKEFYQTADVGKTATSLKPELSISDTLAKNATFGNVSMAASPLVTEMMTPKRPAYALPSSESSDLGIRYAYDPGTYSPTPSASASGEQTYMDPSYTRISTADAKALYGYADGGNVQFPYGESVLRMARGGLSDLGGYSDGGRLLRGPGDGVSDSIPAVIGRKQPARLADGEFVVPARIVSELGNGSTEAGARQLYKMMDRVQKSRAKTTGKGKIAKNTNAARYLPA